MIESGASDVKSADARAYRRAVLIIITVIGGLCVGQSLYALAIGNRFLLKDGLDWGYDVVLWAVALAIFGRGLRAEQVAALAVAGIMAVAGFHTAYDLWDKIATGRRPEFWVAGWSSFTILGVAILLVALMFRFRASDNPLVAATWLSSRNDSINSVAFAGMSLGARTASTQSYEIALDCLAIVLSFQAVWAILTKLRKDRSMVTADGGQATAGQASSAATEIEMRNR